MLVFISITSHWSLRLNHHIPEDWTSRTQPTKKQTRSERKTEEKQKRGTKKKTQSRTLSRESLGKHVSSPKREDSISRDHGSAYRSSTRSIPIDRPRGPPTVTPHRSPRDSSEPFHKYPLEELPSELKGVNQEERTPVSLISPASKREEARKGALRHLVGCTSVRACSPGMRGRGTTRDRPLGRA